MLAWANPTDCRPRLRMDIILSVGLQKSGRVLYGQHRDNPDPTKEINKSLKAWHSSMWLGGHALNLKTQKAQIVRTILVQHMHIAIIPWRRDLVGNVHQKGNPWDNTELCKIVVCHLKTCAAVNKYLVFSFLCSYWTGRLAHLHSILVIYTHKYGKPLQHQCTFSEVADNTNTVMWVDMVFSPPTLLHHSLDLESSCAPFCLLCLLPWRWELQTNVCLWWNGCIYRTFCLHLLPQTAYRDCLCQMYDLRMSSVVNRSAHIFLKELFCLAPKQIILGTGSTVRFSKVQHKIRLFQLKERCHSFINFLLAGGCSSRWIPNEILVHVLKNCFLDTRRYQAILFKSSLPHSTCAKARDFGVYPLKNRLARLEFWANISGGCTPHSV